MTALTPMETLYDTARGEDLPLPFELATVYGRLRFPAHPGRPYVIGNFVTTLDGVVSLGAPGHLGGGDISGFNQHDRMVLGLLRAVADVVVVGAGTLRALPDHVWTPASASPAYASAYRSLRSSLRKPGEPVTAVVTASGDVDLGLPVFGSGETPVLIVTTAAGFQRLRQQVLPPSVHVTAMAEDIPAAKAILDAIQRAWRYDMLLLEGGPHIMGEFFAEHLLDEQFLTLAPQVAGRDRSVARPGFVTGRLFAPEHPLWGQLVGVRRAEGHLFLRYAFEREPET